MNLVLMVDYLRHQDAGFSAFKCCRWNQLSCTRRSGTLEPFSGALSYESAAYDMLTATETSHHATESGNNLVLYFWLLPLEVSCHCYINTS